MTVSIEDPPEVPEVNGKKTVTIMVVIAALVAALAAAAILVKVIVSPDMVKKTVLPRISAVIDRQVTLGDVEVSIFRGIRLRELSVMEKDGSGPFLQTAAARLSYRFWPLLAGRVEVDEVLLEAPKVLIVRYPDGSFNFSDLVRKEKGPRSADAGDRTPLRLAVTKAGVADGLLVYDDRMGLGGKPFRTELRDIRLDARNVSLDGDFPLELKAALPGMTAALKGTVGRIGTAPVLTADLTLVAGSLSDFIKGLPPMVGEKLAGLSLAGALKMDLKLAGEAKHLKQLLQGGEVQLTDVQLTVGGMRPTLGGSLVLGKDSLKSRGLTLGAGKQRLSVALSASNLQSRPVKLSLDMEGEKLDLDQLLPARKEGSPASAVPAQTKKEPGPLNLPLDAGGSVKIGGLLYRGLTVSNFALSWSLRDSILAVDGLKGSAAGGSFSNRARVDLLTRGFAYSSRLELKGMQADQLAAVFAPNARGSVFGTLSLSADLAGRGAVPATVRQNLTGSGTFAMDNGRLTGEGFMPTLAAFLGAEELRALRFSRLDGTFSLKGQVVRLAAKMEGSDARFTAAGTIGFDKSLDMGIDLRLLPAITARVARGDVGRFVSDREGWASVPLRATGSVGKPRFSLDAAKVGGRIKDTLGRKLGEKLLGKEGDEGTTERPEKKLLRDTFKGILGN